jgi:hypothetical protein
VALSSRTNLDLGGTARIAAREAMMLERIHLGQPTEIVQNLGFGEMTLEEAQIRIDMANRAMSRAVAAGGLTVIPGGKSASPVIGKVVKTVSEIQ